MQTVENPQQFLTRIKTQPFTLRGDSGTATVRLDYARQVFGFEKGDTSLANISLPIRWSTRDKQALVLYMLRLFYVSIGINEVNGKELSGVTLREIEKDMKGGYGENIRDLGDIFDTANIVKALSLGLFPYIDPILDRSGKFENDLKAIAPAAALSFKGVMYSKISLKTYLEFQATYKEGPILMPVTKNVYGKYDLVSPTKREWISLARDLDINEKLPIILERNKDIFRMMK